MGPLSIKLFSDYIFFIVDALLTYCNTWYPTELILDVNNTFKTKHGSHVMVLGVVASDR